MTDSFVVTFGEVMGRLMPSGHLRLRQTMPGSFDFTFGGAEVNVAVSLSNLGMPSRFVTALPSNPVTDACMAELRSFGLDLSCVVSKPFGRFGLYYVERGAAQRPSTVTYDRDHSTISLTPESAYDWQRVFANAHWFHLTGITPAISSQAAESCLMAMKEANKRGIPVSFDLNFRKKLWRWEEGTKPNALASKVIRGLLPYVQVLIGNEEDADDVLGIKAGNSSVDSGRLEIERYPEVAQKISLEFPNIKKIAFTLRESISADNNNWGGMLYDVKSGTTSFAPMKNGLYRPWEITDIVDRVGGGDAFGAGLIRALAGRELTDDTDVIAFAVASSCLAHTILGDFNLATFDEVLALMKGAGSGRVVR